MNVFKVAFEQNKNIEEIVRELNIEDVKTDGEIEILMLKFQREFKLQELKDSLEEGCNIQLQTKRKYAKTNKQEVSSWKIVKKYDNFFIATRNHDRSYRECFLYQDILAGNIGITSLQN